MVGGDVELKMHGAVAIVALERLAAGQRLVHRHAKRVDVGPLVEDVFPDHLGRHVAGPSGPGAGVAEHVVLAHGDTEVDQLRRAVNCCCSRNASSSLRLVMGQIELVVAISISGGQSFFILFTVFSKRSLLPVVCETIRIL